jgi:hypothetical protein
MASRMVFTIILLIFVSSITLSSSSGVLQPSQVTTTINYTRLIVLTTTQPTTVFDGNKSPAATITISSTTTETSDLTEISRTTQNVTNIEFSTVTNTATSNFTTTSTITFVNMTINFQSPAEWAENQSVTVSGNLVRADGLSGNNLTVVVGLINGTVLATGVTNTTGGFSAVLRAPPTPGNYVILIVFNGLPVDPYYLGSRVLVQNVIVFSP